MQLPMTFTEIEEISRLSFVNITGFMSHLSVVPIHDMAWHSYGVAFVHRAGCTLLCTVVKKV